MRKAIIFIAFLGIALVAVSGFVYAASGDEIVLAKTLRRCPPSVPAEKCVPGGCSDTFIFDATKSYDPNNLELSYAWDFGDGATSTDPIVTHTYAKGGTYKVILTVTNTSGLKCDTSTTSTTVTVNTPPSAAFSAPKLICANSEIALDASATTDDTVQNLTYAWDLGDGTTAKGKQITKKYAKGGTYTVILAVDDNAGTPCSVDRLQKTIKVNEAPIADAGDDISMCVEPRKCPPGEAFKVKLSAAGSKDPNGDKLTYSWDLGDGNTANSAAVTHVYKEAGTYVAKLVVDDGSGLPCSSDVDRVTITLNEPPVADAGKGASICLGSSVTLDGSASVAQPGQKLNYTWDLGDGTTAQGATVKHTYKKGGAYAVILTVDDGKGTKCSIDKDSVEVIVNSSPSAMIKGSDKICAGTKASFDASSSSDPDGDPLTYMWDFGDGTTDKGPAKISHTYAKGGNYTVRVSVDDGRNTPCSTDSASMSVKVNTPPVANTGPNLVCCIGAENAFDGTGSKDPDGDSLTYMWDFGDGTTSKDAKTTHVYNKNGTYKITLTVDDGSGMACSRSTDSFTATVREGPVSAIDVRCK
jgi:PKD repeat protein